MPIIDMSSDTIMTAFQQDFGVAFALPSIY